MSINEKTRTDIIDNLKIGMPLGNVADLVKLSLEQIQQEMSEVPEFKAAVHQAVAECMQTRLNKLKDLDNWQALAFILQSLWPSQFGRRSRDRRHRRPHVPSSGGDDLDLDRLTLEEKNQLEHLLAKAHGRDHQQRSDEHLPVVRQIGPKLLH